MLQGLLVLCVFADEREHAIAEVAAELDIPTATVYRLARTWTAAQVLELDTGSGAYRLAPRTQEVAGETRTANRSREGNRNDKQPEQASKRVA